MKAQRSTRPLLPAQRCRNCSYIRPSPSFSHSPYSNFQEIKRAGLPVRTHPPLHHASPPQTLNPLPHPSESHKSAPIAGNESQRFTSDKLSHLLFSVFILNFLTLISSPLPPKHWGVRKSNQDDQGPKSQERGKQASPGWPTPENSAFSTGCLTPRGQNSLPRAGKEGCMGRGGGENRKCAPS